MKFIDAIYYTDRTTHGLADSVAGKVGEDITLLFGNFCMGNKLPEFRDGDEFHGCTFVQDKAGTQILPDDFKGRIKIVSSNCQNVRKDDRIEFVDCNEWAQVDLVPGVVDTRTQAQSMVDMIGKDAVLAAVGKTYAKTYFGLTEIQAVE